MSLFKAIQRNQTPHFNLILHCTSTSTIKLPLLLHIVIIISSPRKMFGRTTMKTNPLLLFAILFAITAAVTATLSAVKPGPQVNNTNSDETSNLTDKQMTTPFHADPIVNSTARDSERIKRDDPPKKDCTNECAAALAKYGDCAMDLDKTKSMMAGIAVQTEEAKGGFIKAIVIITIFMVLFLALFVLVLVDYFFLNKLFKRPSAGAAE